MQGFFNPILTVINIYSKTPVLLLENSLYAIYKYYTFFGHSFQFFL